MTGPSRDAAGEWMRFARELATMEDLVLRLLVEHVRAPDGRCECCTTPGRGTPMLAWPCAMWTLARTAQSIRSTWTVGTGAVQARRPGRA